MLYLVKSNNAIKIGSTEDVKMRMQEYKTHNPDIELLEISEGTVKEEKELHYELKNYIYKNSREWFIDCPEVRKIWDDYTSKTIKYPKYYVEYCKPHSKRISKDALLKFGIENLYGQPLYNIITKEEYKHVQDWLEKENLTEDYINTLYLDTPKNPIKFINPDKIKFIPFYSLAEYKTLEEVYNSNPFNINLYLIDIKQKEKALDKKNLNALNRYNKCFKWITENLEKNKEYSFEELEKIFKPMFIERNLTWDKSNVIKMYFPYTLKRTYRTKNKIKKLYYIFNIF